MHSGYSIPGVCQHQQHSQDSGPRYDPGSYPLRPSQSLTDSFTYTFIQNTLFSFSPIPGTSCDHLFSTAPLPSPADQVDTLYADRAGSLQTLDLASLCQMQLESETARGARVRSGQQHHKASCLPAAQEMLCRPCQRWEPQKKVTSHTRLCPLTRVLRYRWRSLGQVILEELGPGDFEVL